MNLYSVSFVDAKDGCSNHKLIEALSEADVKSYMLSLGHTEIKIEKT